MLIAGNRKICDEVTCRLPWLHVASSFLTKKKHKQHLQGRHTSCRGATVSSGALQYLQWRRRRGGEELRDYGLRTLPIVTGSPNRVNVCGRPWTVAIAMPSKLVCVRKSKMCETSLFWLHPAALAVLEMREKRHYFSAPHSISFEHRVSLVMYVHTYYLTHH